MPRIRAMHCMIAMLNSCSTEHFYFVCVHKPLPPPPPGQRIMLELLVAKRFVRLTCVKIFPFVRLSKGPYQMICGPYYVPIRCTRAPTKKDFFSLNLQRLIQVAWRPIIVPKTRGVTHGTPQLQNVGILIHLLSSWLVSPNDMVVTVRSTCFNFKYVPQSAYRLISEVHVIPRKRRITCLHVVNRLVFVKERHSVVRELETAVWVLFGGIWGLWSIYNNCIVMK